MVNKVFVCVAVAVALFSLVCATSDCELPPHRGPCNKRYPSYYFDMNTRTCRPFFWSGCGGNGNKFYTLEECHFACSYFMKLKPNVLGSSLDPSKP